MAAVGVLGIVVGAVGWARHGSLRKEGAQEKEGGEGARNSGRGEEGMALRYAWRSTDSWLANKFAAARIEYDPEQEV